MIRFALILALMLQLSSSIAQDTIRMLIVYPDSFENQVKDYAKFRSTQVEVNILPLSKIGQFPNDPELRAAIREKHTTFAFNHLLLVGSGRNLPMHLSSNGTYNDHFYSHLDEDGIPDIAVGRIPVDNRSDLESYLTKVRNAQSITGATYQEGMILKGHSEEDSHVAEKIRSWMDKRSIPVSESLPFVFDSAKWYDASFGLLVFQIGQGNATGWMDINPAFTIQDADRYIFPNSTHIISVACSTAGIQFPDFLAATLLFSDQSGVLSYIGCTGNCFMNWTENLGIYIIQTSTVNSSVGSALLDAKKAFPSLSIMASTFEKTHTLNQFILLGDPSLPLPHQTQRSK